MGNSENGRTAIYSSESFGHKVHPTTDTARHSSTPNQQNVAKRREYFSFAILVFINLLNYMDRYTIAGVLSMVQDYYVIDDSQAGLLQTVFIAFFTVFSPICGFLGDRFNRKWIMAGGISIWLSAVVACTFVPSYHFWLFALLRGVVGIGEASYAVICPAMIADMFHGTSRSKMLMIFYFAIPVGSGMGYAVGSSVASLLGGWEWGVRSTALFGLAGLILIIVFVVDPPRGIQEVSHHQLDHREEKSKSSYLNDLRALVSNSTFISSTFAYTAVIFAVGTLGWWVPTSINHVEAWKKGLNDTADLPSADKAHSAIIFGGITSLAGIAGVSIGTVVSSMLKKGAGCLRRWKTSRADPIMCVLGSIIAAPTLLVSIICIQHSLTLSYISIFFSITGMCFNWAIQVDMLMTVVIPTRRSAANAWQILISHLCGDGSGPYIIGLAFYIPNAVLILSIVLFMITVYNFPKDRRIFCEELGIKMSRDSLNLDEKKVSEKNEIVD